MTFQVPENCRLLTGLLATPPGFGNEGAFLVSLRGRQIIACCIASSGAGWEHVSVHIEQNRIERIPTWEEMCRIKDIFWGPEDCVIQYHPPKSDYVNCHKYTLHLWRPTRSPLPRPPSILVGPS